MPGGLTWIRNPDTRGSIKNLAISEDGDQAVGLSSNVLDFFFRPAIREQLGVLYGDMGVQGMSHSYKPFERTENLQIPLTLYWNAVMMRKELGKQSQDASRIQIADMIDAARNFIHALHYPAMEISGMTQGANPLCILSLPGVMVLRCRVISMSGEISRCDWYGRIMNYSVDVVFEEAAGGRVTMQDVLQNGTYRTWGSV
jgi:hypothetical protein